MPHLVAFFLKPLTAANVSAFPQASAHLVKGLSPSSPPNLFSRDFSKPNAPTNPFIERLSNTVDETMFQAHSTPVPNGKESPGSYSSLQAVDNSSNGTNKSSLSTTAKPGHQSSMDGS